MSGTSDITTIIGRQLYELLPEVYRTRDSYGPDARGDLARFLDACGELLDLLRNNVDQRLADAFPDNPPSGLACQPWLLPYFADLLDVRLVSPDEAGRRDEVAMAVAWRQRKGTSPVLEQIAERVGRLEVEMQEGWQRAATTPRIDLPLLPATAWGETAEYDQFNEYAPWAAQHPGLPSVTVDVRHPSRALRLEPAAGEVPQNPAAKQTRFGSELVWWRQINRHGIPCHPGSFDDVSRRTVDVRTPDWRQGHVHPRRVILYAPPPLGFFEPDLFPVQGDLTFSEPGEHVLEDLVIDGTLQVTAGTLQLKRCAVRNLVVSSFPIKEVAAVTASDCIFQTVSVTHTGRFEYCTVLKGLTCGRLQASDCLFDGSVHLSPASREEPHCVRYSRLPVMPPVLNLLSYQNTREAPVYYQFEFEESGTLVRRVAQFGEPGCAVLHPATPAAVRFGTEDSGEMGSHHSWRYCLLLAAVQEKLKNFLPVGSEAVIVPDLRLHRVPAPACPEQV